MDTLEKAKNDLKQGWKTPQGAVCQCCGQLVKLYNRNIYAGMARDLISLYHKCFTSGDYFHRKDIGMPKAGGGDFAKLAYWGLIEEKPNDDNAKRTSGYWRITYKGRQYVENRISVPKYAQVYNGRVIDFDGEKVSIIDALGKKYDYRELMGYLL